MCVLACLGNGCDAVNALLFPHLFPHALTSTCLPFCHLHHHHHHHQERLVCSVPGRHRGQYRGKWGHMKLRALVQQHSSGAAGCLVLAQTMSRTAHTHTHSANAPQIGPQADDRTPLLHTHRHTQTQTQTQTQTHRHRHTQAQTQTHTGTCNACCG